MFALSRLSPTRRLSGLLEEVRLGCVLGVLCLADLSESLTLGGNGLANGEDGCALAPGNAEPNCFGDPDGVSGEGDRGELGEPPLGDFFMWNLDGERDRERRRVLMPAVKSEFLMCVGEGIESVPPLLLEYDMIWMFCDAVLYISKMRYGRTTFELLGRDYALRVIDTITDSCCMLLG